ncbi:hypothetical protein JR316_0010906 [Psilocybe cubensis]|uniref:Uncharacterized protein n=1 Tax=Psilocybe cubensis TaxID=181762 RepID=A0ACB8GPQ9_PSICU|nr:hypothetical protein JR316_0010906 [Psilocybe cubensis]KAH9476990.1 hypothetical protein JR316_0010906 [Psilocybe cubensis]
MAFKKESRLSDPKATILSQCFAAYGVEARRNNVRATRTSTSSESGSRPSISPTSSTYSADLALLDDLMDSPYDRSFLPLTPTEETLPLLSEPDPGYYPTSMGSVVTGGHPLPAADVQGFRLPIDQNLNIVVSGYTGYGDSAFANPENASGNMQGFPYDYYPSGNQLYLTQGPNLTIDQGIASGWEPDANYIWNSSTINQDSIFDQAVAALNTTHQYSEFRFPQLANDNHYMPDIYQSNTLTQHEYYSGP